MNGSVNDFDTAHCAQQNKTNCSNKGDEKNKTNTSSKIGQKSKSKSCAQKKGNTLVPEDASSTTNENPKSNLNTVSEV